MKLKLYLIIVFLIPGQVVVAQDYLKKPVGDVNFLSLHELRQHEKSGGYYNEFWNYHIALDNGSEIYLNYSVSHFGGIRDATTGARLSLINWEGRDYKAAREYDLDKLVFNEKTYKFFLNPERGIWFEGKLPDRHKVHFKTNKNGTHFDININFTEIEKSFSWGDGKFELGENDLAGMYVQVPAANVQGYIALDYDTVYVTGHATMTQFHQTNIGTRLFEKSFRFSQIDDDRYSGGYFLIPKDAENEVVGFAYEKKNGKIYLKKPTSISVLESQEFKGENVSSKIEICYQNQNCETIEIQKIDERITMLDELGGLKKIIAKRFLGGDIIELRGKGLINGDEPVYYSLTKLD